jgi:KDO2-lipid IV(A) lauroyltransferase
VTELRHRVTFLALVAGAGLVASLPLGVAVAIGEFAGFVFGRIALGKRAMARRHAARVGVPSAEIGRHLDLTFRAYGRYWAEALWMRPKNRAAIDDGISHDGVEHVERPRDAGTGMIYVLPHLGNWEFAGALAESLGIRVVAVAENLANRRIRDWFIGLRNGLGIDVVLATGSRQVMRDLEAAIASNAAVALLSDRDLKGRGVEVEFFGETTTLPAGAATLAMRTGAPILPVASYFRSDGGHHVVIRPPIPVERAPGDRSAEVARVTGEVALELEGLIRRAPEQWHLLQPNWPSDREHDS